MTTGSSMLEMTRSFPPQRRQVSICTANTRCQGIGIDVLHRALPSDDQVRVAAPDGLAHCPVSRNRPPCLVRPAVGHPRRHLAIACTGVDRLRESMYCA